MFYYPNSEEEGGFDYVFCWAWKKGITSLSMLGPTFRYELDEALYSTIYFRLSLTFFINLESSPYIFNLKNLIPKIKTL